MGGRVANLQATDIGIAGMIRRRSIGGLQGEREHDAQGGCWKKSACFHSRVNSSGTNLCRLPATSKECHALLTPEALWKLAGGEA